MSTPRNDGTTNDAYNELLRSFSSARTSDSSQTTTEGEDVKNHGEIYFSANAGRNSSRSQNTNTTRSSRSEPGRPATRKKTVQRNTATSSRRPSSGTRKKRRNTKKQRTLQTVFLVVAVCVFVFLGAFLVKIPLMGCINDVLAINVSDTDYRVIIGENQKVDDVIDTLAKQHLINNPGFCKMFVKLRGYDQKKNYPSGTYFLSSDMGVEGMLYQIQTSGKDFNTVMLTFPEGYTVEQIVSKLSENGVASEKGLYDALENEELFKRFGFLEDIPDKKLRLHTLEGYLYPDTYEFYIGEDPESVIEKFLKNFKSKWETNFAARARELGLSVDEVINIASIIQKEAFDAEQMPIVSSVIHNRLDAPSKFPFINCDSTRDYINVNKDQLMSDGTYANYLSVYDTYQKTGLPIGPISSPGEDAIRAALNPTSSEYYYFLHSPEGKIYLAKTEAEHEYNKRYLG